MGEPPERRQRLRLEDLEARIRDGSIDTVISAITDLQGRLMGKRMTGDFFLAHAQHGTHFCTYLLGTDMEMRNALRVPAHELGDGLRRLAR